MTMDPLTKSGRDNFLRAPSDKVTWHRYTNFYDRVLRPFRYTAKHVLEIGVCGAESLRMWEGYFENAHIHGIDLYDRSKEDTERITTYICDQSVKEQMDKVIPNHLYDLIIDDGCHKTGPMYSSLQNLWHRVRPGGIYIIEDLHAEQATEIRKDLTDFFITAHTTGMPLPEEFREKFKSEVDSMALWLRPDSYSQTAILWKKFYRTADMHAILKSKSNR